MQGYGVQDLDLTKTKTLPNGATSATSDAFDLGHTSTTGVLVADCELVVTAPALVVGDLADAATMTYDVLHSDNADMSSPSVLVDNLVTQTGAGGAGAATAEGRCRLPSNVKRYVAVRATNSGAGDASDKSMTVKLVF